jgi:pyruvate kinase
VENGRIHCTLLNAGVLKSRKGVNLPQTPLTLPSLTPKDEDDLRFALSLNVDMIALSFVRRAADLNKALEIMDAEKSRVPLIAKIEKPQAVEHLDEIINTADGVMVARGDLGVEMGPEEVPIIQKTVIERCNARGKLVITATQMLDSMIRNPRPTRAEASDVANAVLDGSDALMLSGETAVGVDPPNVVATMDRIIRRMERGERLWQGPRVDMGFGHGPNAIARSAVECSSSLDGNAAIVVFTGSGGTARLISDYRPKVPIIAYTPNWNTYQSLSLYWGVIPRFLEIAKDREEHIFEELDLAVQRDGFVPRGSTVVMVMGFPIKARTSVNLIKLHRLSECLPTD